jgi:hypothetical protein
MIGINVIGKYWTEAKGAESAAAAGHRRLRCPGAHAVFSFKWPKQKPANAAIDSRTTGLRNVPLSHFTGMNNGW